MLGMADPAPGRPGSWVSLSHCQGGDILESTTILNFAERRGKFDLSPLLQNFIDEIEIFRCLSYRYLGINSLCILQDSKEDWRQESSRMSIYYKSGIVITAAERASNSHSRIIMDRGVRNLLVPILYPSQYFKTSGVNYVWHEVQFRHNTEQRPLSERKVSSSRMHSLTTYDMFF